MMNVFCMLMFWVCGDAVGCNAPSACSLRLEGSMSKDDEARAWVQ